MRGEYLDAHFRSPTYLLNLDVNIPLTYNTNPLNSEKLQGVTSCYLTTISSPKKTALFTSNNTHINTKPGVRESRFFI